MALAQNNLQPNGLYLFDAQKRALSPQRQLTLLMEIYKCAKKEHSFYCYTFTDFTKIPDADIYCFDDGRIHLWEYEETGKVIQITGDVYK